MSRFRRLHLTMLALTFAILLEPSAEGAQTRLTPEPSPEHTSFTLSSKILNNFWNQIARMLTKTGCSIDPNGHCPVGGPVAPAALDTGCSLDPHGGCGTGH
jgi:hypothetical protein